MLVLVLWLMAEWWKVVRRWLEGESRWFVLGEEEEEEEKLKGGERRGVRLKAVMGR